MSIIDSFKKKKYFIYEVLKWISVITLMMTLIVGSFFYCKYNLFLRTLMCFLIVTIILCIILTTNFGKSIIVFARESRLELKKIVWPTFRDGLQITLVVIAVTMVMSLVLWGLDTILVQVISFGLRI